VKRAARLPILAALALACPHSPAARASSANEAAGERAWRKCISCHALEQNPPRLDGPPLRNVVGRRVASVAGFVYSPALRAHARRQRVWTREALDVFIADPQAIVPGNAMGFFGIKDLAERAALIAYIERF
jgi:cytochrome c